MIRDVNARHHQALTHIVRRRLTAVSHTTLTMIDANARHQRDRVHTVHRHPTANKSTIETMIANARHQLGSIAIASRVPRTPTRNLIKAFVPVDDKNSSIDQKMFNRPEKDGSTMETMSVNAQIRWRTRTFDDRRPINDVTGVHDFNATRSFALH
jgi:hypothetical protein